MGSGGVYGVLLDLAAAMTSSRSTRMRSSNAAAGSSLGSWGTSLPENACLRTLCRSRPARCQASLHCSLRPAAHDR